MKFRIHTGSLFLLGVIFIFLSSLMNLSHAANFPYYVENNQSNTSYIVFKGTGIWTNGTSFYIYSNGSVPKSNGYNVFEYFDNFENGLNTSLWDYNIGAIGIGSGGFHGTNSMMFGEGYSRLATTRNLSGNYTFEWDGAPNTNPSGVVYGISVFNIPSIDGSTSNTFFAQRKNPTACGSPSGHVGNINRDFWTSAGADCMSGVAVNDANAQYNKFGVQTNANPTNFNYYIDNQLIGSIITLNTGGLGYSGFEATGPVGGGATDAFDNFRVRKNNDATISCGALDFSTFTVDTEVYLARRKCNISTNVNLTNQQYLVAFNLFNNSNLLITDNPSGVRLISPVENYGSLNKTITFIYEVNTSFNNTVELWYDGALLFNETVFNTTVNITHNHTTTYGTHNWFVSSYNTSENLNSTTSSRSLEIFFNITNVLPPNGATLTSNTTNLSYSTSNLYNILCNTTVGFSIVNSTNLSTNSSVSFSYNFSTMGTQSWFVRCYGEDNLNYYKTITRTLNIFSPTLLYSLNLTNYPANVLSEPQFLFYDIDGYLNAYFFIDSTLNIFTINNTQVLRNYSVSTTLTNNFLVVFREPAQTQLLTFQTDNSTLDLINLTSTSINLGSISTTYNITNNTQYDPYAYANTKQFAVLNYLTNSYQLFVVANSSGGLVTRKNISDISLTTIATASHGRKTFWQTLTANENLTSWYYALEKKFDGTTDTITLYQYNGTEITEEATPDSQNYNQAEIERAIVLLDGYQGQNYMVIANISNKTTIYSINQNLTFQLNNSVSAPSNLLFIDKYTFVFFSQSALDVYAYSCYFGGTSPACNRFTSTEYGLYVPYDQGPMTTAKRIDNNTDVVTKGLIQSSDVIKLIYNQYTYDAKFICYDEQAEYRKLFTMKIFAEGFGKAVQNQTWGWVAPSSLLGSGQRKFYSQCTNGTSRLYLSGLTSNFKIDFYSLNLPAGAFYTFHVTDEFGQDIQGATITAYRFSIQKQAYVTVEQGITDYTGTSVLFLEPFNPYKIVIQYQGFVTANFDFTPAGTTNINIRLLRDQAGRILFPEYQYAFDNVQFNLTPRESFVTHPVNITFQIFNSNNTLEYYGMNIYQYVNGSNVLIFNSLINTQPTGGIITYHINNTGTYYIDIWFKVQNFSEYSPLTKTLTYGNSSFSQARDVFNQNQPISGWGFFLIGIICAMLVAGFMSRYTYEGAGLIGLAILWGFALFNSDVSLGCFAGAGSSCMTPLTATILTTIATVGAVYLMSQNR